MSWLSDGLDWLGSQFGSSSNWGSDLGDFVTKNTGSQDSSGGTDWLKLLDKGRQAYNLVDSNSARQGVRSDLADIYSRMEADNALYQQQLRDYQQREAAGALAAKRRNDAAARKAQNRAIRNQKRAYGKLIAMYQPYADAAKELTPNMAKNYNQFLDTTALLNQYLTPTVMGNMQQPFQSAYTQPVPQAMVSIPVPKAEQISFPTLQEALKRGG